jgi:hypothetical protein
MRYKVITEPPKRGEDKWAASIQETQPTGLSICRVATGFGKTEQRAIIDAVKRLLGE